MTSVRNKNVTRLLESVVVSVRDGQDQPTFGDLEDQDHIIQNV